MFNYSDPAGMNFGNDLEVADRHRNTVHSWYIRGAQFTDSAFTLLDAFAQISDGSKPQTHTVSWPAFPQLVAQTHETIDRLRFSFQEEYVEWEVEDRGNGSLAITFTTEFREYFMAYAAVGSQAVIKAIQEIIQGANPTTAELFGSDFDPDTASAEERAETFQNFLPSNPWNNGNKGILCLTQGANSLSALIILLTRCSVPRPELQPGQVCAAAGGACVDGRSSDPRISLAVQNLALSNHAISAADPVGIFVESMGGTWTDNGTEFDINNKPEVWNVSRNRRRGVLNISPQINLDGSPIRTGAQVSARLSVAASVISAPEAKLPDWAGMGNEAMVPT